MRAIRIDFAKEGMKLARDIVTPGGLLLLSKGRTLTSRYVQILRQQGASILYIDDPRTADIVVQDPVPDELRLEAGSSVAEIMSQLETRPGISEGANFGAVFTPMRKLVAELAGSRERLIQLVTFKTFDSYTFQHCVEVAALSVIIGLDLGMDDESLSKLAVGCALHDIGKVLVPKEILNKPGPLDPDEMEEVRKHPRYGFELLKGDTRLSPLSVSVALSHHERCDGSGYPRGITADRLHIFARIAAVADVYDAMTTDRPCRKSMRPHEALQTIRSWASRSLDDTCAASLERHVAPYPPGFFVKLNTGEIAVVTKVSKEHLSRPVVRVVRTALGQDLDEPRQLDLSQHPDVEIERLLDDPDEVSLAEAA